MKVMVTGAGGIPWRTCRVGAGFRRSRGPRTRPVQARGSWHHTRWGPAEVVQADLLTAADLRLLCRGIDVIVHLAAAHERQPPDE